MGETDHFGNFLAVQSRKASVYQGLGFFTVSLLLGFVGCTQLLELIAFLVGIVIPSGKHFSLLEGFGRRSREFRNIAISRGIYNGLNGIAAFAGFVFDVKGFDLSVLGFRIDYVAAVENIYAVL